MYTSLKINIVRDCGVTKNEVFRSLSWQGTVLVLSNSVQKSFLTGLWRFVKTDCFNSVVSFWY